MAVFFWYFVKCDLSSCKRNCLQGTKKIRPCLSGRVVPPSTSLRGRMQIPASVFWSLTSEVNRWDVLRERERVEAAGRRTTRPDLSRLNKYNVVLIKNNKRFFFFNFTLNSPTPQYSSEVFHAYTY